MVNNFVSVFFRLVGAKSFEITVKISVYCEHLLPIIDRPTTHHILHALNIKDPQSSN